MPDTRLTVSFSGAVRDLPELAVPTRVGGFGGVAGLGDYINRAGISLIIDATHPFAFQMSCNAAAAAEMTGCEIIRLERAPWEPEAGDRWRSAANFEDAKAALDTEARAFFAVGRKEIGRFTDRTDLFGLVRMIEPPKHALPDHWKLVLSRPSQQVEEEMELFAKYRIDTLVSKNSGGTRAYAKIAAARNLKLPVIMIERPRLPTTKTAESVAEILRIAGHLANH